MIYLNLKNILQPTSMTLSHEDISSDTRQIYATTQSMLGLSGLSTQDAVLAHNARIHQRSDHYTAKKIEQDWNDAARRAYMRKLGIKP